jgi:hypothetical protein
MAGPRKVKQTGTIAPPGVLRDRVLGGFYRRALMIFRAGLALKVVGSLVRIDALARLRGGLHGCLR